LTTQTENLLQTVRTMVGEFAYLDESVSDDDPLELDSLDIAELLGAIEIHFGVDAATQLITSDVRSLRTITAALERGGVTV
jgi:acyl carrier protein